MKPGRSPESKGDERISTPHRELAKLRQKQAQIQGDPAVRDGLMDSVLETCGEVGYRRVTVETICRCYGGSRALFYRHFESKADCFMAAYSRESERLAEGLLSFGKKREAGRLREALELLAVFVVEHPLRARALFVEVHVAGGDVLGKRQEVFERLSLALDQAGRETVSRHSAPPLAGELMINVVDQAVSRALVEKKAEEFSRAVPEMTALISEAYGCRI